MASRLGKRSRWILAVTGVLLVILFARNSFFQRPQGESEITRPNFQQPDSNGSDSNPNSNAEINTLAQVLELAEQLKRNMESQVRDYTATVVKRERIKGKLGNEEFMEVKIRHARPDAIPPVPFSVYLVYVNPSSSAGREVLWIKGENDDKLLTHQFGLRLNLPTDGFLAMMGNKYPINDIGMLNLAEKLIEKGKRDLDQPSCKVAIFENQMVDDRPCRLIQVTHPKPLPGLDYHLAQIFVDNEIQVPIRYAAYLWPEEDGDKPLLEEEYTYLNLQVNPGLTDEDFDPGNPQYKFPK